MSRLRILSVKKITLKAGCFPNVKLPESGFSVILNLDKAQDALAKDAKARKALGAAATGAYETYLLQTAKRLEKFDKLFSGLLAKGAAPEVVAHQAEILKQTLEKETTKWEKAAVREVVEVLKKLEKKRQPSTPQNLPNGDKLK